MTGTIRGMDQHLRDIGLKVERARIDRGWSKEFAAREARISSITWKRVEDGLNVHDTKRAAVLRVLELDRNGNPETATGSVSPDSESDSVRAAIEQAPLLGEGGRRFVLDVYDREVAREAEVRRQVG